MERIRVASVIDAGGVGGAESLLTAMLASRDTARFEDRVLILGPPHPLSERIADLGVPWSAADVTSGFRLSAARTALRALADFAPDVLHSHLRTSDVVAWWYASRARKPVAWVSTLHTRGELYAHRTTLGSRVVWQLFRRHVIGAARARLCAVTKGTAESFRPYASPRARLEVVENGVPLGRFRHPSESERASARARFGVAEAAVVVVAVGRLHPVKGHAVLVRAFAEVLGSATNAVLLVAGEGPERGELEALIDEADLGDRVLLLGVVPDVERLLWAADVFVLPSLSEALPLALIEALACGLPAACSDLDSIPGDLTGPAGCVAVPPCDAHALAGALGSLVREGDTRAALRDRVRGMSLIPWSIERTTRRYEALYEEEVSLRRPARRS